MIRSLIILFLLGTHIMALCQTTSDRKLAILGYVIDSVAKKPIAAATVSIYQKKNGKILHYGFTNNTGFFTLAKLSFVDSTFQIRISHIGFDKAEIDISVPVGKTEINIGNIYLNRTSRRMEEVVINRPPILMNSDTLEINPEAFLLQPNAVVEDLLTKVPGIIVWGDGKITVNGKNVAKVLVEGKPFFGRDPAIATRNLPSDAIEKVKVYESPQNAAHQEEQFEIDIILKNKKKRGLFGKVSFSEGTEAHKEGTFLVNVFNPKNQISLFAGGNNTNKIARNLSDFLAANVYKRGGENIESNTPLFGQTGLNKFLIGGAKFERNWNKKLNTDIHLLLNDRKSENITDIQEIRILEGDQKQYIAEKQQHNSDGINQSYLGVIKYKNNKWDLRINTEAQKNKTSGKQRYNRNVIDQGNQLLSNLDKSIYRDEDRHKGKLDFNLRRNDSIASKFELYYKFETQNNQLGQQEDIFFNNEIPLSHLKQTDQSNNRHELDANLGLNNFVKRAFNWYPSLILDIRSNLILNQMNENQLDLFLDTLKEAYTIKNEAISYKDNLKEVIWTPELSVSKGVIKSTGKGVNSLFVTTALGLQALSRKNVSSHTLRSLDQYFLSTLPSATVRYERALQLSNKSLTFAYRSLLKQPGIYQLIALIDSTQKDYNRTGNKTLRAEAQYQFSFDYIDLRYDKNMSQRLHIAYSLRKNALTDNISYLSNGAILTQTVNATGLPLIEGNYQFKIGKKIWNKPFNIELTSRLNANQYYFFSNGARYKSLSTDLQLETRTQYGLLEQLKIGLSGAFSTNWNKIGMTRVRTGGHNLSLDAVLNWPSRTTLISRLAAKNFYTVGLPSNQQYLWNIELYYRMLKKEQLEIKLSAYDILKNNRTIRNILEDNVIRQVNVNNIQQFFLFSLSYYPRIF
ncbi:carboxypeptidase-like regulatory domain-containing protein [Sphingobacterium puteale]|uniref:carboxypeptidase-like regulatory domain-containing protein n=1 Tax=Sphingobacterium puteale TaxID=2420510 RepID=UPI003D9529E7